MTTAVLHTPAPVLASRRYVRDDRGRFAETPDGGVLDADLYQSTYGDAYDERTEGTGMVSVRVFEDGTAHLVVDHDEEDDGIVRHEVLIEFDDSEGMRATANALQRISMIEVPADADHRDGLVDQEDLGNGWAVGVDAAGNVGLYEVDDDGEIDAEAGAVADMDPGEAYWLAEAIFEMAEAVDDILSEDDGIEWADDEPEDGTPAMVARRTRRVPSGKYNPGQRRDGKGRWSDGVLDPAAYEAAYGYMHEEIQVRDSYDDDAGDHPPLMARVFADGRAHLVEDLVDGDGNDTGHRVFHDFTDGAQMRSVADALEWVRFQPTGVDVTDRDEDGFITVAPAQDLGGMQLAEHWEDGAFRLTSHGYGLELTDDETGTLADALRDLADVADEVVADERGGPQSGEPRGPRNDYNPGQKRDGDGQWSDGIPGDKLGLAKRIQLGDGEELRGSRKLPTNGNSEALPLGAAISTPNGPECRLGIVFAEDEKKWSAANLGGTLRLRPVEVERINAALEAENAVAKARSVEIKKRWAEIDRLEEARDEGRLTDDQATRLAELEAWNDHLMPSTENPSAEIDDMISEGTISAGEWGDLAYQMWGEDDGEAGWGFRLAVRPSDAVDWEFPKTWEGSEPGLVAQFDASDMRRFLKQLPALLAKASPEPDGTATAGVRAESAAPLATTVPNAAHEPGPTNGAMIALVPTDADAARLAVDGGEPADRLHLTLWYLGDAAAISAETRTALVTAIRSMVAHRELPPVEARVFGADLWNADSDKPAWVLGVGDIPAGERPPGQETLAVCKEMMSEAWHDGGVVLDVPPQHTPWQPHICVAYSADPALLQELVDRLGPVVFDRIRVAFADEAVDIPLTAPGKPAPGPSNTTAKTRPAANTGRLLPIRAFTEPTDHRGGRPVGARTEARAARTRMRVQAKKKWFRIENKSSGTDIYLYGEVGYFGITAADFCEELRQVKASTINLHINSPGGQVHEGVAIYGALREHPATVNVTVDGMAASAASFIACAGDRITIMRYAQMMIHEAWSDAYGNAEQLRKQADLLERTSATIAAIYSQRAGGDVETWRGLMKAETWFNADEAVQFGLADDIGGDVLAPARPVKSAWDLSVFAFAGRDRAPTPVLMSMAVADGPAPDGAPADAAETAPVEDAEAERVAENVAEPTGEAPDDDAPDAEPAPEPVVPTDTAPGTAPSAVWAAPAWTTAPADPWRSLVRGLTTPEPSTPDGPTAQEAKQ